MMDSIVDRKIGVVLDDWADTICEVVYVPVNGEDACMIVSRERARQAALMAATVEPERNVPNGGRENDG